MKYFILDHQPSPDSGSVVLSVYDYCPSDVTSRAEGILFESQSEIYIYSSGSQRRPLICFTQGTLQKDKRLRLQTVESEFLEICCLKRLGDLSCWQIWNWKARRHAFLHSFIRGSNQ